MNGDCRKIGVRMEKAESHWGKTSRIVFASPLVIGAV